VISRRDFLASAATAISLGSRRAGASLLAGTARADITPPPGIWMAGFAARREPARGTALPLAAKALALSDGNRRLVLVTLDLLGITARMRSRIAARLEATHGLAPECLMLAASHTHCGPVVDDQLSVAYDLGPDARKTIEAYTRQLEGAVARAAGVALGAMAPARLALAESEARFGANRRVGFLPPGPTDPTVPVLDVADARGRPLAVLFGYACHNTTLQAAMVEFHGDYAGVAQREIERALPGVQAMYLAGCGADVNPAPRGTIALVAQHGAALAGIVLAARARTMAIDGPLGARLAWVDLPFAPAPDVGGWSARARDGDVYVQRHARLMLDRLARDGALEAAHAQPVQSWRLGGMSLVALGGEVVADYALRLKREHASGRLWVAAYSNDVSCYIPSLRVLDEGGYEGGGAMVYYGRPGPFDRTVEQRLMAATHELLTMTARGTR
jgi:neutral ceramidase